MTARTLELGDGLRLPLEAVTQTFGILAVRGAGKSNLGAVLAEQMYAAQLPFVVVDPVGAWWGLRSSADGKGPGLAVPIFGGRHGDVPLERTGGALLADLVVDQRMSCVLDLSEFSEGDKIRFLVDFAERLYRRNEEPLHLILEEADDYAPQRPMHEQARLLRAWENIVRRGRARGLGITMITQRSAALNKNLLTQIETLCVLRTTSPQDRKAIAGWVEYHGQAAELLESLSGLANGEAWIWSPSWLGKLQRIRVHRRVTFDSGATPKHQKGSRAPATLADVNLAAIRDRMAATIERAKAEDPRELRRQITELKRELLKRELAAKAPAAPAPAPKVAVKEVPVLKDGQLTRIEKLLGQIHALGDRYDDAGRQLEAAAREIAAAIASTRNPAPATRPVTRPAPARAQPAAAPRLPRDTAQDTGEALTGPEQRILDAIAWLEAIGVTEPEQPAVAFLAGYTWGGGAFNNPRGRLNQRGLVRYINASRIALTEAGRALATTPDAPLTTAELHRRVLDRLPGPEQRLLRPLLEAFPGSLANAELAERAGYTPNAGAFNNPRGRLRSLGLIDYPEPGRVAALPLLFLEELRG